MCLYSTQITVKGLTITGGNTETKHCYRNAKNLLEEWQKSHLPVYFGLGDHIDHSQNDQKFHGTNGLCDELQDHFAGKEHVFIEDNEKNLKALYDSIMQLESKVIYVVTGACSTIATLYEVYPDVLTKIDRIIIMGTSLYAGNITEHAEFNSWCDPKALEVVINCPAEKIIYGMEPLDYNTFDQALIKRVKEHQSPFAWTLEAMYSKIFKSCCVNAHYEDFCVAYDPGVVPALVKKDYAIIQPANVDVTKEGVKKGKTVFQFVEKSSCNMYVATWVNKPIFENMLFDCLDNSEKKVELRTPEK